MLPFFSLPTASSPPDRHVQPAPGCRRSRDPHARRRQGRCGRCGRPWHQWRRQLRPAQMTRTEEPGHGGSCACARRRRGARPQPDSGVAERGWRDQRGRVRPARQRRPARTTSTEEPGHGGLCASAHHRRGAEPQQESGMGERGLHGSSVLRGHSVQLGNERGRVSGGDGEKSHRRSSRIAGCTA